MADDFEYYETTPEVDQDAGAPPRGPGWELVEVVQLGQLLVHRWRRHHRYRDSALAQHPVPAHKVPDRSA